MKPQGIREKTVGDVYHVDYMTCKANCARLDIGFDDNPSNTQLRRILCALLLAMTVAIITVTAYPFASSKDVIVKQCEYKFKVLSCYYDMRKDDLDPLHFAPSHLDPHLCTHINVAFAEVIDNKINLTDRQYAHLDTVVSLKRINPKLKILLSVGGEGFSPMVVNHQTRKEFIKSAKYILRNHSLDGLDLDWEFPVFHNYMLGGRERQHFSQLLREIRMEFIREKRCYLLTAALAGAKVIADVAYDVDQVNLYVDYANIMTYDYHIYSEETPFTGLNSPLYPRKDENFYFSQLNINYTLNMYLEKGLSRDKIVIGIPTYGHTFKLVNQNNGKVGSPAEGCGGVGQAGYISYAAVCDYIDTYKSDVNITFDPIARVPYLHRNYNWVSYENKQSVIEKAKFIMKNNLLGAMIFSLNSDDFNGICKGNVTFQLTVSVKNTLDDEKCTWRLAKHYID